MVKISKNHREGASQCDDKDTKYCHGCMALLPMDARECPYCHQKQLYPFEVKAYRRLAAILPKRHPATKILLAMMVVYYVIMSLDIFIHPDYGLTDVLFHPPGELVYRWGAHLRGDFVWWRLVTANFVHIGILHIFFNAYALRYVAPYVERAYGAMLTFAAFIVLGTGSMLCSNIFGAPGLVAGASGGLMGFIGLAAVCAHRENTALSLEVRDSMLKWAAITMGFGIVVSYSGTMGIDNIAHASGFILGAILGCFLPRQSTTGFTKLWMYRAERLFTQLAVVVVVAAFAFMASASVSGKYQNTCITDLKIQAYDKAEIACAHAYRADKSQMISYHNYILASIINGHTDEARRLCIEGRKRFSGKKKPVSFDELCRSIGE